MKNRSRDELYDNIDSEYTWRFKEIFFLKSEVSSLKPDNKNLESLVRSLVVVSYAHWEGFVKFSVRNFFDYMTRLGLDASQTCPALVASALCYSIGNKGRVEMNKLIENALTDIHYKPIYACEDMCDPKSNLNYEILEVISSNIGLDISTLSLKRQQLDEIVLGRRNKMAHGERDAIDAKYGIDVADACMTLMKEYKNLLQNMVMTDSFKRIP